jgi:uncharacterized protein (DUF2267 family)
MKDAYSKHLGHKCNIERWLVVSAGDLAATLKRIPHIVTVYQSGGQVCIKQTQSADLTKEGLIDKDAQFRKELMKKSAAAKNAKAGAPPAPATGTKAPGAEAAQPAKAPAAPKQPTPAAEAPGSNGHVAAKKAGGPTRPPSSIEDFLWNIHCVLEASESPMPIESLTEAYSKHLGHKFAIERFLVVGDAGLVATLKRIPHVVTVKVDGGNAFLTPTLPKGSTKDSLVAADQAYRKTLQQKSQAAKSPAPGKAAPAKAAPAISTAGGQKNPSEGGAEPEAKRQKTDEGGKDKDKETLSRMLVQGVCKVLQSRATSGKGPLLVASLAEEFKTHWKVPFNLISAGYSDVNAFLKAWPNKLEVTNEGTNDAVVSLVKKATEKAKAEPAVAKSPTPAAVEVPATAKKAAPTAPAATTAPQAAVELPAATSKKAAPTAPTATTAPQAPPPKAAPPAAAEESTDAAEPEAKKPRVEDQDTLSRMLVQGVVRVLQNRVKEGKGPLLLSDLPEEFKTLWKVQFNLQSAGFENVNQFVKAWTNKLEVTSTPEGDVVALVKKGSDKAKAAAAKSAPEAVTAAPKATPKESTPTAPVAVVPAAESSQGSDLTAAVTKETANGDGVTDTSTPQTAAEIRKELHKIAMEQSALVARQLALIEALNKVS